jgi:hypothetical protein
MSNKYTYSVPFTDEELYDCYVNQMMSQQEIADKFGTTQKVVWRAMAKMGVPTRQAVARNQKGEANNNWRGGRVLAATKAGHPTFNDRGYWYVYDPVHPNANPKGYVAEHIKVATEKAGRPLEKGECVHHVNLSKRDNSPENLAIADHREHALWHKQLEEIAVSFFKEGLIAFDPVIGYYRTE